MNEKKRMIYLRHNYPIGGFTDNSIHVIEEWDSDEEITVTSKETFKYPIDEGKFYSYKTSKHIYLRIPLEELVEELATENNCGVKDLRK